MTPYQTARRAFKSREFFAKRSAIAASLGDNYESDRLATASRRKGGALKLANMSARLQGRNEFPAT